MQLGATLPVADIGTGPSVIRDYAQTVEGLGFNYLQSWQADVAYTNFFGGRTYRGTDTTAPPAGQSADFAESANSLKDRDFISVSVSYAF